MDAERPVGCAALCAALILPVHAARTSKGARNKATNGCRGSHLDIAQVHHRNVEEATVAHHGATTPPDQEADSRSGGVHLRPHPASLADDFGRGMEPPIELG